MVGRQASEDARETPCVRILSQRRNQHHADAKFGARKRSNVKLSG
jgi:hypothetical protein